MAISASTVTTTDTLETFRVEFNNLVADVTSIQQVGASNIVISDGGNIGTASDADAMSISAGGVVTFTQAPTFSGGTTISSLDIDGATDIGAAIVDADLFIIDDGASGTNRKVAASRLLTYAATATLTTAAQTNITSVGTLTALDVDNININGNTITASSGAVNITPAGGSAIVLDSTVNIDAGVVTGVTSLTSNAILIADAGTIGSASSTSAITVASTGIVTFVDDILIKDAGTIGNASVADVMSLASTGIVTFKDDIIIKDGGTIGATSATTAITIASSGIVTFVDDILIKDGGTIGAASATDAITIASTGIVTFVDDIIIKDAGTIGSASDTDAISISSGGVVNISATTANTGTGDGALTVAGGVGIALDASVGDDLRLISDGAILSFGADSEITLTHVHNTGLTLGYTASSDNTPIVLQLKSEEDAIIADEVIASLEFAAGDSDGTDGATVAAGIHAIAEGTFTASANATKLVFTTGVSETAAASATAKMTLSSAGLLTIADDFMIKDGGTIGVASTNDAITISSAGIVTFKDDILIKDGGTIGAASATTAITIASSGIVTFVDDILIKDGGTIGAASSTSAITIASSGIVTFVDDILIKDGGTIGVASSTSAITIASTGIVTFVDDIIIKDAGTIGSASDTDAISISSGGVVNISATTASTSATTGALTVAGGLGVSLDAAIGDDLFMISDSAVVTFGANSEITLTHVHDVGLTVTNTIADTDNRPVVLQLKSEEDAVVADDVIASIELAAGDSDGTDGAVVAAGIHAIAEDTFSASANATKLVFTTGVSETAAASATAKMTLSSAGLLTIADDLMIKDGGTIGVASTNDAITISSAGIVTFKDDILIKDGGTIGTATDADAITIAAAGAVTLSQRSVHSSGITVADGGQIGSASDTDAIAIGSDGDVTLTQDLELQHDGATIAFGANDEITITHVHDVGLTVTNTVNGSDDTPVILQLKSEEDAIVADDVIASIEMAAGDSDGTDGAVVAAGIHAIAEGTFAADANATKLVFTTGVSETAAASATAKMTLSSAGLLTIADDFMIKDGGTIGVASANDAMTISSAGIVTFKDDILIKDGGTIGNASVAAVMTLASTGIVTFADDIVIKDGGTIGVASAATAITIASSGIVTFVDDIVIKDAGTIGSASDTDAISISSGGVVNISATTANTNATDGALTVAGGVGIALDASVGDDLRLISDGAILSFGADNDITLTHVADTGVRLSDSMALLLGTGDDISFSWDGTDGHLSVAGTLNVEGSGETLAKFIDDGAVELYHNNTKRVETSADGITVTGELLTTGFSSSDFAAAFIVMEDGGTDGSGSNAGDNIIIEDGGTDGAGANAGDDTLMENVTSWVTSGFTIRDSFGNHLQTVNGVS